MKTIVVTAFGGPEVMQLQDAPIPEPAENQVLIKVKAAGINYADIMQRLGFYPGGPKPPFGAGFEVAGDIEKAGANVSQWAVGDAVTGFCASGYSEYVVADAGALLKKPPQLDYVRAASIPCQYLTAYHALLTLGRLKAGQTVLVQAAAGGLGLFMVQIARNIGATVIGTCSSAEKVDLLRSLGCQHPINYAETDFAEEVGKITGGKRCDLIVESVGGEVFDKSLPLVKPRGRLIVIGVASAQPREVNTVYLLANNITVSGFMLFAYVTDTEAMANAIRDLNLWLAAGKLEVIAKHVYPIEKAAEAQQLIASRKSVGKVVLKIAE